MQDKEARAFLRNFGVTFIDLNTIYFVDSKRVYVRSSAIFNICKISKFPIKTIYIFSFLPISLTDSVYKWVAKNRYRLLK